MDLLIQIPMLLAHDLEADPDHVFDTHFTGGIHGGWNIRLTIV
jgi:hypothetical protein